MAPLFALWKSADGWFTLRTFGGFFCISWIKTPASLHTGEDYLLVFSGVLVTLHRQSFHCWVSPAAWGHRSGTTRCSATAASPSAAWCSDTAGHRAQHRPSQRHRGSTRCTGEHLLCPPRAARTAGRRRRWAAMGHMLEPLASRCQHRELRAARVRPPAPLPSRRYLRGC